MEKYSTEDKGEYLSLREYDFISEKILKKHNLALSNENINYINRYMMLADYRYRPEIGLTREQFRGLYATYAKKNIFTKFKKKSKKGVEYSLDFDILIEKSGSLENLLGIIPCSKQSEPVNYLIDKEFIEFIKSLDYLNEKEKDCLVDYLTTNDKMCQIGKMNGLQKKQVYFKINNAVKKIKKEEFDSE